MPSVTLSLLSLLPLFLALSSVSASSHLSSIRHRRHFRRGLPSGWQALGCRTDSASRTLAAYHFSADDLTPQSCIAGCDAKGYAYAGVEFSRECFCSNELANGSASADSAQCGMPCSGNSALQCGGNWHLSVFSNTNTGPATVSSSASPSASPLPIKENDVTPVAGAGSLVAAITIPNIPSSSSDKLVVTHLIVGNTYSFTSDTWKQHIALAQAAGIDGFALNFGTDDWQPGHMAAAYDAAGESGFKIFLSFDATANPCGSAADADRLRGFISQFYNHPAQLRVKGNPLLSTFAGEGCTFGQGDVNSGWASVVKNPQMHFVPSFFVGDPVNLKNFPVTDGDYSWDGGWSRGPEKVNFDIDATHIAGNQGKTFMAAASPWFYTHYSYKNFLWYTNDFLYSSRWEQLIAHRDEIDIVQVISWNDFGESHYIGPVAPDSDQPNSQAWVNGYDHEAWQAMTALYARAFKTGKQIEVTEDRIVLFSRPHSAGAGAPDPVGKPSGATWFSEDVAMAVVFLTQPGSLTLTSGGNTQTFALSAGVSKVSVPNAPGTIRATLARDGKTVVDVAPTAEQFTYTDAPKDYNYNAFVATGSA